MKEFEKWEGMIERCSKCTIPKDICARIEDSVICKFLREDGWRAALEEVLDWLGYSIEHKEIADKIYEELES